MNPSVDFYFEKEVKWKREIEELRKINLGCGLTEELKWGTPCYTDNNANIVLIHVFKEYCALLFFKGALLSDPDKLLIQQSKNVQSARQMRFTNPEEVKRLRNVIKVYVYEAIQVEKSGLKVTLKKASEYKVPEELKAMFQQHTELRSAFRDLTPGRQRGYLLYFAAPKQAKTRIQRIEKSMTRILNGKGLND